MYLRCCWCSDARFSPCYSKSFPYQHADLALRSVLPQCAATVCCQRDLWLIYSVKLRFVPTSDLQASSTYLVACLTSSWMQLWSISIDWILFHPHPSAQNRCLELNSTLCGKNTVLKPPQGQQFDFVDVKMARQQGVLCLWGLDLCWIVASLIPAVAISLELCSIAARKDPQIIQLQQRKLHTETH